MNPIKADRDNGLHGILVVGVAFALLGCAGCQSMPSGSPVPTYAASTPDASAAIVRLVSAESAFWRIGQNAYVETIDGQASNAWTRAKVLKFTPGAHTIKVIYCANAGGSTGTVSLPTWQNVYDRQELAFEVASGKTYNLIYDVKQWPTPHKLHLTLIDCSTQETVADSGASKKQGIMPIGTIP